METAISLSFSAASHPRAIHQCLNIGSVVSLSSSAVIESGLWRIGRQQSTLCSGSRAVPSFSAMAEESRNSKSAAPVPVSVPVRVAHELLQAGHRYLDVRTTEEFDGGHVVGAVNVPFLLRTGSDMTRNPKFVAEVSNHFGKDDEIIVGCQIGKRSFMAASELMSAGFTGITDMAGGYAAWLQNGLPTTD